MFASDLVKEQDRLLVSIHQLTVEKRILENAIFQTHHFVLEAANGALTDVIAAQTKL